MGKRKDVSDIISAAGWIAGFMDRLVKAMKRAGWSHEDIHMLVREGDFSDEMMDKIVASLKVKTTEVIGATGYPITIDPSKSLEELIEAGQYGWTNSDINTKNFPSQGEVVGEVVIELLNFGRNISTDDALVEMDKRGLRPAMVRELAAFGADYPDIQREFPVMALGSVWRYPIGGRRVACLGMGGSGRGLGLDWLDGGWLGVCRFAGVRKS